MYLHIAACSKCIPLFKLRGGVVYWVTITCHSLHSSYFFRTDRKCCISLPSHQRSLLTWDRDRHVGSHWTQHKDKVWICNCEYIYSFPHKKILSIVSTASWFVMLIKKDIIVNASMLQNYFEQQHCTRIKKIIM